MRKYVYADEAGCFAFTRNPRASRFYIICTVEIGDPNLGNQLLDLRRELIWADFPIADYFHAAEDKQTVRNEVFELIRKSDIKIGATILEKSKAQPHIKSSDARFYKHGWYFHLSGIAPKLNLSQEDEVLFTTASIGTKKGQIVFTDSVRDVLNQKIYHATWKTHFCPSMADPGLQIADYCTWAIQRKWERGDDRSYDLISHAINHEYETWQHGTTHYY